MEKYVKLALSLVVISAISVMSTAALAADPFAGLPIPNADLTIAAAPVVVNSQRGTEFEKGYRFSLGYEAQIDEVPGLAVYNELSYMSAARAWDRGDISTTSLTAGVRVTIPTACVLVPYANAGIGGAYIDQSGSLGGSDWRPTYQIGAGIASFFGGARVDVGWQLDATNATGGRFKAHTFAVTTHIPISR